MAVDQHVASLEQTSRGTIHVRPARLRDVYDVGVGVDILMTPGSTVLSAFDDKTLLAVAGVAWSVAWVVFTKHVRPKHFPALHKRAERVIAGLIEAGVGPVVIHVDPRHPQGLRWAKLLKFTDTGKTTEFRGQRLKIMERN